MNIDPATPAHERSTRLLLLASVFTIATCGLIYELIAGTLASYLLGDSITQFSTVIGVFRAIPAPRPCDDSDPCSKARFRQATTLHRP